ncbi:hypothetical protein [Paenibacillus sp. 7541]|uniref:hypothetical protein n=1 Tax=Paenibacillus sp. 7541 TaxID=2026236 RepID=UPI000BA7E24A|nr:hypothetical protein [Paenibacillus sp. 7541]PAK55407.1 hypothetical protein CHH75_03965 [Paenibacillus sp. 7541]
MTITSTIEVYRGPNAPSLEVTVTPDLYPIGYRYSRRDERFILVWKPEGGARQEIDVHVRILASVLPSTAAGILEGFTEGCVMVTDVQLYRLGFFTGVIYNASNG